MFKSKSFVSLSVLSFALSSSALFAMQVDPELPEEKHAVGKASSLTQADQRLRTYTYNGKKVLRGEVQGDGACSFWALDVLFPEENISRETFITRTRQIIQDGGQYAQEIKEDLASELLSGLYAEALQQGACEYRGNAINSLKPKLFLTQEGDETRGNQERNANIRAIVNNDKVIEEVLENLARPEMMLTLPMDGVGGGSFIIPCKIFKLNLFILWVPKEAGTAEEKSEAALFKKFSFGEDTTREGWIIRTGPHYSPVCEMDDSAMRVRFAQKMLSMIEKGQGVYQNYTVSERNAALNQFSQKTDPNGRPPEIQRTPLTVASPRVQDLMDLVNSIEEKDRKGFIKELEAAAAATYPDFEERKQYLVDLATVKDILGAEPAQVAQPKSVVNHKPAPDNNISLKSSKNDSPSKAVVTIDEHLSFLRNYVFQAQTQSDQEARIEKLERCASTDIADVTERKVYLQALNVVKGEINQPVEAVNTSPSAQVITNSPHPVNHDALPTIAERVAGIMDTIDPELDQKAKIVYVNELKRDAERQVPNLAARKDFLSALDIVKFKLMFDLKPTGIAQSVKKVGHETRVTTDHNATASYQLESNRFDVALGQEIQVSYNITVEKDGVMSLGFLNTKRNGWYGNELILREGSHKGIYVREVPQGEQQASVVFRNYHLGTPGQTTFTIHDVDIEKQAVAKDKLRLQQTPNPQSVTEIAEVTKVVTDYNAHATYQLESDRYDVVGGQRIRVPYEINVEKDGKMSIGLLNTNRNGWYGAELILGEGLHKGVYERIVPQGETQTSLVFRNYHLGTPGQTTFTFKGMAFKID